MQSWKKTYHCTENVPLQGYAVGGSQFKRTNSNRQLLVMAVNSPVEDTTT